MSEKRIYYLLRVYTNKTATDAEERELFQWVSETTDDTVLKDHIQQVIQKYSGEKYSEVNWEHIYRNILKSTQKKKRRQHPLSIWYKIAGAAAVAAFLIISGIYLFSNKKQSPADVVFHTTPQYKNDIKPGGTKAILQAGATQVILNKEDTSFILAGNAINIHNGGIKTAHVKPVQYTLITPRGGTYKMVLSDGTKVWLNAQSKLIYSSVFTGDTRAVSLTGEAYFEVKTDANHPFIVKTAKQNIKVLGTEFNVHAYADEPNTATTLIKGKVEVNSPDKQMILHPGQQAICEGDGQLHLNTNPDIKQIIAWKDGYFRFDKADIHTIMQKLSRWYDIKVKYEKGLPAHHFGAIMNRNNNISQILNMLEGTGDVHFKIEGKEVTVMP